MYHALLSALLSKPKYVLIFGLVFGGFFGFLTGLFFIELQDMPEEPVEFSLSEQAEKITDERIWVKIVDGVWHCDQVYYFGDDYDDDMEVILTNSSETAVVVVSYSSPMDCSEIMENEMTGELSRMNEIRYEKSLEKFDGFRDFPQAGEFFAMCGFCGRGNSEGLVIIFGVLALASFSLYPIVKFSNRNREADFDEEYQVYEPPFEIDE